MYWVYILTNKTKTVLYIGLTSTLVGRIAQHKAGTVKGFTQRYKVNRLIYAEGYDDILTAKARERALKKWNRSWKNELISRSNPAWDELTP